MRMPPLTTFDPWQARVLKELTQIRLELVEARRERFLDRKALYEAACYEAQIESDWQEEFKEELEGDKP